MKLSARAVLGLLSLAALFFFLASLYFEWVVHLMPCPLCILQRSSVLVLFVLAGIGFLQAPKAWGVRVYAGLGILVSLFGLLVATRQSWLQYFATGQVSSCGVGLSYMLTHLPLHQTLVVVFAGSGECNVVTWSFLGLSMAAWMVLVFVGFIISYVFLFCTFRRLRHSHPDED